VNVVAIARLGSFRAAALDLEMSPTAIGNAVASLENRLGVRLFNRTTRNVAPVGRSFEAGETRMEEPIPLESVREHHV
jgi:DNA-binding transcriptional LysR family regulator